MKSLLWVLYLPELLPILISLCPYHSLSMDKLKSFVYTESSPSLTRDGIEGEMGCLPILRVLVGMIAHTHGLIYMN